MGIILSLIVGSALGSLIKSLTAAAPHTWPFATTVFLTFMGGVLGALAAEGSPLELGTPSLTGTLLGGLFAFVMLVRAPAPNRRRAPVRRVIVELRSSTHYD